MLVTCVWVLGPLGKPHARSRGHSKRWAQASHLKWQVGCKTARAKLGPNVGKVSRSSKHWVGWRSLPCHDQLKCPKACIWVTLDAPTQRLSAPTTHIEKPIPTCPLRAPPHAPDPMFGAPRQLHYKVDCQCSSRGSLAGGVGYLACMCALMTLFLPPKTLGPHALLCHQPSRARSARKKVKNAAVSRFWDLALAHHT